MMWNSLYHLVIINAEVRIFPKTSSNYNQLVSSCLKNFDRVWKDLMSVKQKRKPNERFRKLVSENEMNNKIQQKVHIDKKKCKEHTVKLML
jgi:hypothetical protein